MQHFQHTPSHCLFQRDVNIHRKPIWLGPKFSVMPNLQTSGTSPTPGSSSFLARTRQDSPAAGPVLARPSHTSCPYSAPPQISGRSLLILPKGMESNLEAALRAPAGNKPAQGFWLLGGLLSTSGPWRKVGVVRCEEQPCAPLCEMLPGSTEQ